jgi:hypothetical protein
VTVDDKCLSFLEQGQSFRLYIKGLALLPPRGLEPHWYVSHADMVSLKDSGHVPLGAASTEPVMHRCQPKP